MRLVTCFTLLQVHVFAFFGSVQSSCPSRWEKFGGSCYQLNTITRRTWNDAVNNCSHVGAHPVYINSVEEDRFVVEHLQPLIDASSHNDKRTSAWIGGTDNDSEGMWVWQKSDQPIVEYTNWYPGQPDTGSGHHEEDYICLVGNHGYMWQDYSCSLEMFYVCEKSLK